MDFLFRTSTFVKLQTENFQDHYMKNLLSVFQYHFYSKHKWTPVVQLPAKLH